MTRNDRPAVAEECALNEGMRNVCTNRHMFFLALGLLTTGLSVTDCRRMEDISAKNEKSSAGD